MKKIAIAMLFAGSTLLMADGAAAYAKCVGCHGANGEKAAKLLSNLMVTKQVHLTNTVWVVL